MCTSITAPYCSRWNYYALMGMARDAKVIWQLSNVGIVVPLMQTIILNPPSVLYSSGNKGISSFKCKLARGLKMGMFIQP